MKVVLPLYIAAVLSPLCTAQEDDKEYEQRVAAAARLRDAALANLKQGKPLIDLAWRRNAAGDFEFRIADDKGAKFEQWFAKGIAAAVGCSGIVGESMLFLHDGDALSLTHGGHHLRRLGIGSATADLVSFARSPLPEQLREVALLDRLVAIDLLARRGDDGTSARSELAADATLDAQLRDRAAGTKPARRSLDAASLVLPARCDLVVVCNHARLFDALPLVEIGHIVNLVVSMQFLQMLRVPLASDAAIGQTTSEFCTELPFELARSFGNPRLDQTVVAWSAAKEGDAGGLVAVSAGRFSPPAVVAGVPRLKVAGGKAELADGTARAELDGVELVVTDSLATAKPAGLALSARPELSARLLAGDVGLRAHVPAGSSLLSEVKALGIQGVESIDATVSFGKSIVIDAVLKAKDNATAGATARQVRDQVLRRGWSGILARLALEWDDEAPRLVAVVGDEVRVHLERPCVTMESATAVRNRLISEHLR